MLTLHQENSNLLSERLRTYLYKKRGGLIATGNQEILCAHDVACHVDVCSLNCK